MQIEAYFRVVGDESTIRTIEKETNLSNASIKQLKAPLDAHTEERCWAWQTSRVPIDIDDPDKGLRALLRSHTSVFPTLRKHAGPDADVYLEVVTRYEGGEEPRGLYLSAETIQLIGEMGGAFDNDVVTIGRVVSP